MEGQRKDLEWEPRSADKDEMTVPITATATAAEQRSKERRERRLARYERVVALHASGSTQKRISAAVGLSLKTVRRWLRAGQFPERKRVLDRRSHVREFAPYLEQRWKEGCRDSTQLWHEIRHRGYRGSRQMVPYLVAPWRKKYQPDKPKQLERLAPKQATVLICRRASDRSAFEQQLFQCLIQKSPSCALVHALAVDFRDALQQRDAEAIRLWIHNTKHCGIGPLVRFAWAPGTVCGGSCPAILPLAPAAHDWPDPVVCVGLYHN